jgi:hypothetical protein
MSSADRASGYMRRRIHARHVSYEEEDTCIFCVTNYGFIFPTIVDKTIVKDRSRENETQKFGLGKPVVMW